MARLDVNVKEFEEVVGKAFFGVDFCNPGFSDSKYELNELHSLHGTFKTFGIVESCAGNERQLHFRPRQLLPLAVFQVWRFLLSRIDVVPSVFPVYLRKLSARYHELFMEDFVKVEIVSENIQTFVRIMFIPDKSFDLKFFLLSVRNETFNLVILRVFYPGSPNILNSFGCVISRLQRKFWIEIFLVQAYDDVFAKCSFLLWVINDHLMVARRQKRCITIDVFVLDVAVHKIGLVY